MPTLFPFSQRVRPIVRVNLARTVIADEPLCAQLADDDLQVVLDDETTLVAEIADDALQVVLDDETPLVAEIADDALQVVLDD